MIAAKTVVYKINFAAVLWHDAVVIVLVIVFKNIEN